MGYIFQIIVFRNSGILGIWKHTRHKRRTAQHTMTRIENIKICTRTPKWYREAIIAFKCSWKVVSEWAFFCRTLLNKVFCFKEYLFLWLYIFQSDSEFSEEEDEDFFCFNLFWVRFPPSFSFVPFSFSSCCLFNKEGVHPPHPTSTVPPTPELNKQSWKFSIFTQINLNLPLKTGQFWHFNLSKIN